MMRQPKEKPVAIVRRTIKHIRTGKANYEVIVYNLIHRGKVYLECNNYGQAFRQALQIGYGGIRVE